MGRRVGTEHRLEGQLARARTFGADRGGRARVRHRVERRAGEPIACRFASRPIRASNFGSASSGPPVARNVIRAAPWLPPPRPATESTFTPFTASNDLACLDLDGNLIWYRGLAYDYPDAGNDVGMSSSPVISGDCVIVQIENQGDRSWRAWIGPRAKLAGASNVRGCAGRGARRRSSRPKGGRLNAACCKTRKVARPMTRPPASSFGRTQRECDDIPSPLGLDDVVLVPSQGLTALKRQPSTSVAEVLWKSNKLGLGQCQPCRLRRPGVSR